MSLTSAIKGDNLILVSVNKGMGKSKQLADLGLVEGTKFKLVNCQSRGPVVIELKGTRLAIGHNLASHIMVARV